jgi:hypothetical protein
MSAFAEPAFVLWDSAVIASPAHPESSKSLELIYSTQPLASGQLITTFVPIGRGYRVMCCLRIKDGSDLTLKGLEKDYAYDPDFVGRVRAIKGVKYVYGAEFLPIPLLSKHMKQMAESAGDTYYSTVGLIGKSDVDRIKDKVFDWPDYGQVQIETISEKSMWRHKLKINSRIIIIDEPSLPD